MQNSFYFIFKVAFTGFLWMLLTTNTQAQDCRFTFKGTLAGKQVTMCFYPDGNDGAITGNYYYGNGNTGSLSITGTATAQSGGGYRQKLEEINDSGEVTGVFVGILKNGVMTGTWTSADGTRSYKYNLVMQKN
jgi:hypothetical protein